MLVAVLGHRGMLGRRVLEEFPEAITFDARYPDLLPELEQAEPDWVINCIAETHDRLTMWQTNMVIPRVLARRWNLIQPSTDHVHDDTYYAATKRHSEVGHVIRCGIVDPEGGMLARAHQRDTQGATLREWNGITTKAWAKVARMVMASGEALTIPGSPTISHYDLLERSRRLFGWPTHTIEVDGNEWHAATPTVMLPAIEEQLREYA